MTYIDKVRTFSNAPRKRCKKERKTHLKPTWGILPKKKKKESVNNQIAISIVLHLNHHRTAKLQLFISEGDSALLCSWVSNWRRWHKKAAVTFNSLSLLKTINHFLLLFSQESIYTLTAVWAAKLAVLCMQLCVITKVLVHNKCYAFSLMDYNLGIWGCKPFIPPAFQR